MRLRERLAFAQVKDVEGAVTRELGVASSPTLLVLPAEGEPVKYEGEGLLLSLHCCTPSLFHARCRRAETSNP